jgi:hypothetical protein
VSALFITYKNFEMFDKKRAKSDRVLRQTQLLGVLFFDLN